MTLSRSVMRDQIRELIIQRILDGTYQPGQRVVLFSYGFGAHWTGVAVEA